MTNEELREVREQKISKDLKTIENFVRHAFNQGYELGYQQHSKDFVERGEKAYQQGLEDGRKQGVAIDGDKRYWAGYHAAQEDGQKIYQKGLDDAWACVRRLSESRTHKEWEELYAFFGVRPFQPQDIFEIYTASEAIEKIRAYEEKQKQKEPQEIKIGDEVIYDGRTGVVDSEPYHLGVDRELFVSIWFGGGMASAALANVKKTGRHFDGIEDALKQMSRFNPPGSGDGKPCTMCPAEGRSE